MIYATDPVKYILCGSTNRTSKHTDDDNTEQKITTFIISLALWLQFLRYIYWYNITMKYHSCA